MSDLRVDTLAIEKKYGLLGPGEEVWNVTPIWSAKTKSKQVVAPDNFGAADRVVRGVIRIFEARTATQHREAVEILDHDLLWDGPPIRLSSKGHVRLAAYLFKYFAHVSIIPVDAVITEPTPGHHLIELDAVAVSKPHRPIWLLPTQLLPAEVAKNVHLKIGVTGGLESGKVDLLVGRLTNWPPFLPFAWSRTLVGILMGAVPHSMENALGFFFDFADGGDYYARKRHTAFKARHPDSTNPTWDWLTDLATDVPNWLVQQGSVAYESVQALTGRSFERVSATISAIINFYAWLFSNIWGVISNILDTLTGTVSSTAENMTAMAPKPGTAGAAGAAGTGFADSGGLKGTPVPVTVTRRPVPTKATAAGGV